MTRLPTLPESLVTPYHGFAILTGGALILSLLWPDPRFGRALFPQALVLLQGTLSLQVGEVEHGFGPLPAGQRLRRLLRFVLWALGLVGPFILIYRAETAASWPALGLSLGFLLIHGFVWSLVGHELPRAVKSDGLRFLAKYGGLALAEFLPLGLGFPGSGIATLLALWEGRSLGWLGAGLYLSLGGLGTLWILWRERRRS